MEMRMTDVMQCRARLLSLPENGERRLENFRLKCCNNDTVKYYITLFVA